MPSGAGHDAQVFAPLCPTGMIFIPSEGGVSHNAVERTSPDLIAKGLDVFCLVLQGWLAA
jgi:acetylornithine deacetylase/succinyl-diaminopimelate desuccinylase-like protein